MDLAAGGMVNRPKFATDIRTADLLRGIGSVLDAQHAVKPWVVCDEFGVHFSWQHSQRGRTASELRLYRPSEVFARAAQAQGMRGRSSRSGPEGRSELLRTLGQELESRGLFLRGLVDDRNLRVRGFIGTQLVELVYTHAELRELSRRRRAEREGTTPQGKTRSSSSVPPGQRTRNRLLRIVAQFPRKPATSAFEEVVRRRIALVTPDEPTAHSPLAVIPENPPPAEEPVCGSEETSAKRRRLQLLDQASHLKKPFGLALLAGLIGLAGLSVSSEGRVQRGGSVPVHHPIPAVPVTGAEETSAGTLPVERPPLERPTMSASARQGWERELLTLELPSGTGRDGERGTPNPADSTEEPLPTPLAQLPETIRMTRTTVAGLRLRAQPSTGAPVLEDLPLNTPLGVAAGIADSDGIQWIAVTTAAGRAGWVARDGIQ
jgi:hypothetical protein